MNVVVVDAASENVQNAWKTMMMQRRNAEGQLALVRTKNFNSKSDSLALGKSRE